MNLHIVALFTFKENYLMDAIEILKKLVILTRKEEGCLQYDLIEDRNNKGVMFLVELWETEEHHYHHSSSEHLDEFRRHSSGMMESQEVYRGHKIF